MTAYYTAYQQYSSQVSSASSKWTEYANGLYAKANISIYGLFAYDLSALLRANRST